MNLLDAEDMIKSLPDQALMQQAQMPTGEIPQFLVISEIKNRADMRKRYEAQLKEQPQGTVAEQVMREGIAGMMPQQGVTPQMGQQPPQGGPQMPQQGMPPQGGPQGMPPQGMPPQGMPPQMPPQGGPQGMPPQMPPQGMPPQGMPPGMPPMGMAAGGIVRMRNGGILDQYVAGAEAGPMPGGSTVRDQIDRVLGSGMSYPEILSFISKTFYGKPEVLEYVQSKVGRPEPTMGSGGMGERSPSVDINAPQPKLEYAFPQEGPQAIRESAQRGVKMLSDEMDQRLQAIRESAQIDLAPQGGSASLFGTGFGGADYPSTKPGTESADPLSGMLELAQEAYTDASDPRRQLSPSIDTDALISGMVSERAPRSGGIPDLSTAPQRGAGGRPFDVGVFGDLFGGIGFDLGMPTREQGMAADRARVERIQQKAAGTYDDPNTPEKRRARLEQLAQLGVEGPDETVQEINERLGIGPAGPVTDPFGVVASTGDITVQGNKNNSQKQGTGTGPAGDTDATLSLIDEMMADLRGREAQASPTLDLSDILARSKKMTDANILMQLGSGIAGGDVAKGIEKAGMAGVQGAQEAAKIEMAQRIAQTKAGQEDIRRGEQRDLDIAKLGIQREQVATMDQRLKNELSKAERVSKGQLFNLVSDLVQEATGDMVTDDKLGTVDKLSAYFMQKYAPLLGIDLSEEDLALLGRTYGGAGSPDPLGIRGAP